MDLAQTTGVAERAIHRRLYEARIGRGKDEEGVGAEGLDLAHVEDLGEATREEARVVQIEERDVAGVGVVATFSG